jgi:hypothetical protein
MAWTGGTGTRKLTAIITATKLPGISLNEGSAKEPDWAVDVKSETNKTESWSLGLAAEDKVAAYGPSWGIRVIKTGVAEGVSVKLEVHSFDFGGSCTIRVTAEPEGGATGGSGAPFSLPQDTDGDKLADAWEKDQEYWYKDTPTTIKKAKYETGVGHEKSTGITAANDGESDQDLDAVASPVHAVFGDGISAFDEYRGLTIQGVHKRFNQLADDGPIGGSGGTALKDAFIFPEKKGQVDLFRGANTYLKPLGVLWHVIKKDEM